MYSFRTAQSTELKCLIGPITETHIVHKVKIYIYIFGKTTFNSVVEKNHFNNKNDFASLRKDANGLNWTDVWDQLVTYLFVNLSMTASHKKLVLIMAGKRYSYLHKNLQAISQNPQFFLTKYIKPGKIKPC